jgi:ATP-dependent Clp protease ATP-binding subunit ClpC
MLQRFDDAARRVVVLANDEARKLNHQAIDTRHVLLGVLRESRGVAATTLTGLGIGYGAAFGRVEAIAGRGTEPTPSHVPFTEDARRALERSLEESLGLGHDYIGPEHILLALMRDENDAARMVSDLGAEPQDVRDRVLASLR